MLTLRGLLKDGQIIFLEDIPLTGEHQVLVTFLDTEGTLAVVSKKKRDGLIKYLRESDRQLSAREIEVLELAQSGARTKDIAKKLGLSAGTVRNHLSSTYSKLEVSNKTEAIKRAVELGLLPPIESI